MNLSDHRLLELVITVWVIGDIYGLIRVGMWVERHRFGGSEDLRDDVDRLRNERDRARAELDQRRHSAMPTLRVVNTSTVREIDNELRRLSIKRGAVR